MAPRGCGGDGGDARLHQGGHEDDPGHADQVPGLDSALGQVALRPVPVQEGEEKPKVATSIAACAIFAAVCWPSWSPTPAGSASSSTT